jgi:peptidoglycan hydrolase-like protein with peptidoglycan-binding domain
MGHCGVPDRPVGGLRAALPPAPTAQEGGDVPRRPGPTDHLSDHASEQDPTVGADRRRPARAARGGRAQRSSLPWGAVVAGAGAVTLVVAAAGMVGAATGGPPAVVVPGATSGGVTEREPGSPVVIPRADEPRPTVTRIPPRDDRDEVRDPGARQTTPSTPSAEPEPGTRVAEPAPQPSVDEAPRPSASPSPTTSPTREPAPAEETATRDARWVQERLRAHGATVELTGELDEVTVAALRAFQTSVGLPAGGTVDAATLEALAAAPQDAAGDDGAAGQPGGDPTERPSPSPTGTPPANPFVPPGAGLPAATPSGAPTPAGGSAAG